jgi:hypothetical protein
MFYNTSADKLAEHLGFRIKRKRNGTYQVLRQGRPLGEPTTMVEIEKTLAQFFEYDEQGMTPGSAACTPTYRRDGSQGGRWATASRTRERRL